MKLCRPLVRLVICTGLSAWACGQGAVKSQDSSADALKDLKPGVVIERFDGEGSGAKRAGLHEGDVLLRWIRGEDSGKLESPFDVSLIQNDQVLRGPVRIEGLRGTDRRVWTVTQEYWGATTLPNFSDAALVAYHEAMKLAEAGQPVAAAARWRVVADDLQPSRFPSWLAPWFLGETAASLAKAQHWKESDDAYQEAILESASAGTAVSAQLLATWGAQLYARGDWDQAEKCFERAAKGSVEADAGNLTADALDNLAMIAKGRGNLDQADEYFSRSLEIRQKLEPGRLVIAGELINRGLTLFDRGDLSEAEQYFRQALAIYEKKAPRVVGVAFVLDDLGEVARLRGDLDSAERYLRRSLALEKEIDPGTSGHATILKSLATALEERGNRREAEKYLRQSIAIQERLAPGGLDDADARQSLGDLARQRFDFSTAEQAFLQALAIRQKLAPEGLDAAETLHSLGDVALARGDLAKCESYYQRALAIREKLVPKSADHANTLAALAGIANDEGQFDKAISLYEQAFDAWEGQSARLGGGADVRAGFRAKHQAYYRKYINLLVSQNKPELAFQILERSRARSLLEMLATAHVDVHKGVDDPALLEREHSLSADLHAKSSRRIQLLSDQHTDEQVAAIDREIRELLAQLKDVEEHIRASSPSYAALTQPKTLSAKEIQLLLDEDTLLLEYSLGEERSYVFAVTANSLNVYELPKRARIESSVRRLHQRLTTWERGSRSATPGSPARQRRGEVARQPAGLTRETGLRQAAADLSEMVLAPVAGLLQGKRLLIVSDGALQYIPFSALPTPPAPTMVDERKSQTLVHHNADALGAPLIAEHEVVYLPSASVLAVLRQDARSRPEPAKMVAVLADPVFDLSDERLEAGLRKKSGQAKRTSSEDGKVQKGRSVGAEAVDSKAQGSASSSVSGLLTRSLADVRGSGRFYLSRLPYTRQEAQAIMLVTPEGQGMEALGFSASRATAMGTDLGQYRIVHFATHGLLDSENPELSGLVFSLLDQKGKRQDGFLQLQDIYNLNLPVDLVVLSACETGLGKEIQGEGLVGLTRGFMHAGASRVVASLWKVDDVATAELMGRFYKNMEREKMRPAAALRQAQMQMWRQRRWHDPYYWAGFELQGEWK